jgi:hypothetical protein
MGFGVALPEHDSRRLDRLIVNNCLHAAAQHGKRDVWLTPVGQWIASKLGPKSMHLPFAADTLPAPRPAIRAIRRHGTGQGCLHMFTLPA